MDIYEYKLRKQLGIFQKLNSSSMYRYIRSLVHLYCLVACTDLSPFLFCVKRFPTSSVRWFEKPQLLNEGGFARAPETHDLKAMRGTVPGSTHGFSGFSRVLIKRHLLVRFE